MLDHLRAERQGSRHGSPEAMTACLLAAVLLLFCTCSFAAAEEMVMAITLDDLPSHGLLPPQMTRVGIAESVIRTLKDNGVPSVYGFLARWTSCILHAVFPVARRAS